MQSERVIYSNFVEAIKSDNSKSVYNVHLRAYMRFLGIWNEEANFDNQSGSKLIDMTQDQIFESIKSFILDMRKRNLSTSSIIGPLAALKLFYEMNDNENIRWKKLHRFIGEATEEHEDRAYTVEEIRTLLNVSDLRLKVTVLLAVSTGMRIGAFNSLLKSHLEEKKDCYKISVYKGLKGKGKYVTFCSPEARKAVEDYFAFRERFGEILTPNSPVLRKGFDTEIPDSAKVIRDIRLTKYALSRDIWKNLVKSGIRQVTYGNKSNRKEVKMSHGFRKFYDSCLIKAGIHPYLITGFIGHSKKGLEQRYARLTDDERFIEYCKAVPLLTIDPSINQQKTIEKQQQELSQIELMKLQHNQQVEQLSAMVQQLAQRMKVLDTLDINEDFSKVINENFELKEMIKLNDNKDLSEIVEEYTEE